MSIAGLAGWCAKLARGQIQLGRIHLACGAPLVLDADTDVRELAHAIIAEHQRHTTVTSFHLRAFLAETGLAASGVTAPWLAGAIERRGGRVLPSELPVPSPLAPALASSLRNQWQHWFYGDAVARFPESLAIRDHVARNAWFEPPRVAERCARVAAVVDALFAPITRDFAEVAAHLAAVRGAALCAQPVDFVRSFPAMHLPHVEDTYRALADRGILIATNGGYAWGARAGELDAVIDELTRLPSVTAGVRKLG
jgi:hypothetical protein